MFGRSPKEPNPSEGKDLPDVVFSLKPDPEDVGEKTGESVPDPPPEVVMVVEKISGILSPYFIVLVGLFLYDRNAFIGFILIGIGVLSILGFSWDSIPRIFEEVKKKIT